MKTHTAIIGVDGILQSWDGHRWHPVTIDRKSHHYNGKKWMPDHPAGHVRTIPCKGGM